MIDLGPHALYIVSGYVGVTLVTLGLIGWTWARSRTAKARLAALDKRGIRRRSGGSAT